MVRLFASIYDFTFFFLFFALKFIFADRKKGK